MMKKITLLTSFLCLLVLEILAQKGNSNTSRSNRLIARAQAMINQQVEAKAVSRSVAFLLDSTRFVRIEDVDSLLLGYTKFKYLPDGKIKEVEIFDDAISIAIGTKIILTWNLAKSRVVRNDIYIKSSIDEPYVYARVDSLFYDAKNNKNKTKSFSIEAASSKLGLMGWKTFTYKTNHIEADTIKTYELDGTTEVQTGLEFNGFDAKGNIVENYTLDLIDVAGAGEHTTYKYDSKNNLIEALYSDDLQSGKWINTRLNTYKYNAKNLRSDVYHYINWDNGNKVWGDSSLTRTIYNSFNKPLIVNDLKFDTGSGKWAVESTIESFYDKNNNEALDYFYTFDAGDKVLTGKNRYWWSLYKDAISTKDVLPKGYDLTFANPIENGKTITIVAPNNQVMNLTIFDTTGKLISSQQVENQQSVMININTTGHFVAVLSDEKSGILMVKRMMKL